MAALPLHELIGVLVSDLIRGEAHAHAASAAFLESTGFSGARAHDDWGGIRFIRFSYSTKDPDGNAIERKLRVPLLALLPIPLQQIEEAEYEFFLRVSEVKPAAKSSPSQLHGDIAPYVTEHASVSRMPRIRVKLKTKQSDLPAGLSSSLRRIEESSGEQS